MTWDKYWERQNQDQIKLAKLEFSKPNRQKGPLTEDGLEILTATFNCYFNMCDGRGQNVVIEGNEFRLRDCKCKGVAHFINNVFEACIPEEFYKSTIKSFDLELYEIETERNIAAYAKRAAVMYVERWMDFKSVNKGLFFHSATSGSGKTKLAISTLIALMKNSGFNGRYVTEGNLVTHLKRSYGHKEKVHLTKATIEHIMPQTLTESWKQELGSGFEEVHEKYLHIIGNLTLSGYNSELSNEPFSTKKKYYSKSNFELNKAIDKYSSWNEQSIIERTESLFGNFISAWPYFGLASVKDNDVTGSSPRLLFIGDETIKVKVWREVLEHTIMYIYKNAPAFYQELLNTRSLLISVEKNLDMRSAKQLPNGHYVEANFSAKSIYTTCKKLYITAGFTADTWGVEVELK